jgi:hypothetical protein
MISNTAAVASNISIGKYNRIRVEELVEATLTRMKEEIQVETPRQNYDVLMTSTLKRKVSSLYASAEDKEVISRVLISKKTRQTNELNKKGSMNNIKGIF